jgi:transketolase
MKKNNKNFLDTFIMSKGHSCIAQYVILKKLNILKKKDLDNYCKKNGILGCHPDYGVPGIEASTGSLGHGMGLACGIAHAHKINKNNRMVYVILSDGELQEGSTWESMMMAANLNLDNLIVFLDHNGSQSFGSTKETHPKFYPIKKKIIGFNWDCNTINGHSFNELKKVSRKIYKKDNKPKLVICNTIKGKGVSFMENKPIWHYRSPNINEYKIACNELKYIRK